MANHSMKYPPNPPAVGQSDTIGMRTEWYLVMVLISVVLAIAAVLFARRLADRVGGEPRPGLSAQTAPSSPTVTRYGRSP